MLKLCYNIFHVESATLSVLKVKGYLLHYCNNLFSLWIFCIFHFACISLASGQEFSLIHMLISPVFQDFILEIHHYKIYHLVPKVSATAMLCNIHLLSS
jgi:hypothetical protein